MKKNIKKLFALTMALCLVFALAASASAASNEAVATVDANGVVTGVKEGTTKVICAVGDVKCETIVRVTDKKI